MRNTVVILTALMLVFAVTGIHYYFFGGTELNQLILGCLIGLIGSWVGEELSR